MGAIGVPPALEDAVDSIKDAIDAGRTDIFRKLLEACETCDGGGMEERQQLVNSLSTNEGSFLHMATKLGHCDIIRALLAAGADPGVLDKNGNTPIQLASSSAVLAVYTEDLLSATAKSEIGRVCQLVASGMSVNSYDNKLSKNTPLHWAASFADTDTINCLIARGADVNSCNSDGASPLHDAIARGELLHVEVLLENGANPHIRCSKGRFKNLNGFDMAEGNNEMRDLLKKFSKQYLENGISNGNIPNGSISPALARLAKKGSYESLASLATDSLVGQQNLENRANSQSPTQMSKIIRAQSVGSIGEDSVISNAITYNGPSGRPIVRSPLESTSSLELTPNMEQVCERLAAVQLTIPPRALVTNSPLHHLWPQPARITELKGPSWELPNLVTLTIFSGPILVHQIVDVWNIHKPWLSEVGCDIQLGRVIGPRDRCYNGGDVTCIVNSSLTLSPNHYSISVEESKVSMICGSLSSLHHCLVTFVQLLRVFKEENVNLKKFLIPPLVIVDYPSLPNRGFLLDLSPMARVPKLDRVCQIIDSLVGLKLNQLHLLFKITKKSLGPTPAKSSIVECSLPYNSSELVSLERYCNDRGISLVPAFDLDTNGTSSLDTLDVINALSDSLVHFPSSRFVHVGPFLTSFLVNASDAKGRCLWTMLSIPPSSTLMVCANLFHANEDALQNLPLSTVLVEYGFQADYDFSKGCRLALEKGRSLSICSGTAAWTSLCGWPEAGVSNVYSGVVSSLESGANCLLVAHWSNSACLTPFVFAWPPLLVAAGLSWNHTTHWDFVHSSVGMLIDQHLVKLPNCGLGDCLIELGRCETWLTRTARDQSSDDPRNLPSLSGSTLYQLLTDPDSVSLDHLTSESFSSVMRHVRKAVKEGVIRREGQRPNIGQVMSTSKWPLSSLSVVELHLAMDMIVTACRLGRSLVNTGTNPRSNMGMAVVNPGVSNLPPTLRTDLANKLLALREVHSSVWLQGNQVHGLQCSLLVFSSLLSRLLPEQTIIGV